MCVFVRQCCLRGLAAALRFFEVSAATSFWNLMFLFSTSMAIVCPPERMGAQSPWRGVINGLCLGYCKISTVDWASLTHVTVEDRWPTRRVDAH